MNYQNLEPTLARKCAQLKQKIRLSKCEHNSLRILFTEDGSWLEYCIDCGTIVLVDGVMQIKTAGIHCIHNDDNYIFAFLDGGGWIEYCTACFKTLNIHEP
jgi:hypothetical protein